MQLQTRVNADTDTNTSPYAPSVLWACILAVGTNTNDVLAELDLPTGSESSVSALRYIDTESTFFLVTRTVKVGSMSLEGLPIEDHHD